MQRGISLEERNVTANPMKDINAATDLVETYIKSLVVAAAMEYFGMKMPEDKPSKNEFNLQVHHDRSYYVKTTLTNIIDSFFIPRNDEVSQVAQFKCTQCIKEYKTRNGLRKHIRANHTFKLQAPAQELATQSEENDSLYKYARCATIMCLLALNFNDARKMGDGLRLIRMYKYMLLHFKASGKHKYSFQVLRLLAQVHFLISPRSYRLVWNSN
ncbi:hypothetical protein HOLleu_03871 [Holothuria leucospilota]|uniref:C2H2-type domain-containing protein n=1 Tax=Holothuria leucospilota TaxID=206669 RepID=A0A9Q1CSK0_HOLLE|nr:hypothetical protein HOLleu_03871 [Holothuria leucospilota]